MPTAATLSSLTTAAVRAGQSLARRSDQTELLDHPEVEPAALAANLRDLVRLNRLPGGAAASIAAITALAGDARDLSILDVGTGAGDLPRAFARHGRRGGGRWRVAAIDNRRDISAHAARRTALYDEVRVILAEAIRLPLEDASVDVAHSSLLLHHLDPEEAVAALHEMRRVARIGVVINDLRRGLMPFLLAAPIVMAFGRSPMTRHDGLLSLRRAYTLGEQQGMLDAAGLDVRWRSAAFMPRVATAAVRRGD